MNAPAARHIIDDTNGETPAPVAARFTFRAPMDRALASLGQALEAAGFTVIGVECDAPSPGGGRGAIPAVLLVVSDSRTFSGAGARTPRAVLLCAIACESHGDTVVGTFTAAESVTRAGGARMEPRSLGDFASLARCLDTFEAVATSVDKRARHARCRGLTVVEREPAGRRPS